MPVSCWVSHGTVFQLLMSLCDWKMDDSPAVTAQCCTTLYYRNGYMLCQFKLWLGRCISTFCTGMKETKKVLLQGFTATSGWIWAFILKVHLLTHLSNLFLKNCYKKLYKLGVCSTVQARVCFLPPDSSEFIQNANSNSRYNSQVC